MPPYFDPAREPLLTDDKSRFILFPVRSDELPLKRMHEKIKAGRWEAAEIDLGPDKLQWKSQIGSDIKNMVKVPVVFFATADGIVMENLAMMFSNEVKNPWARMFYYEQIQQESVHAETYNLILNEFFPEFTTNQDKNELNRFIAEKMPTVAAKTAWAMSWINPERSFPERLVAFAVVEGVLFSASFCALHWLKKKGLLPGITFSNELISRDEGLHCEFACLLYSMLNQKLDFEVVERILRGAVEAECSFAEEALSLPLLGINADMMKQYIEFIADRLSVSLGYGKIYGSEQPFPWMESLSLDHKKNMFEGQVAEYRKVRSESSVFEIDADF